MDLRHAAKDLGMAVYFLATDPGAIHSRLKAAATKFAMLKRSDFPEDLAPQFDSICQSLRAVAATADEGRITASTIAMPEEQAVNVARQIVALDMAVWERLLGPH